MKMFNITSLVLISVALHGSHAVEIEAPSVKIAKVKKALLSAGYTDSIELDAKVSGQVAGGYFAEQPRHTLDKLLNQLDWNFLEEGMKKLEAQRDVAAHNVADLLEQFLNTRVPDEYAKARMYYLRAYIDQFWSAVALSHIDTHKRNLFLTAVHLLYKKLGSQGNLEPSWLY